MLLNLSVRDLFLALTSHTVIYGEEEDYFGTELRRMGFQADEIGNYYIVVGEGSKTMFTSHLDTATSKTQRVQLRQDERFIFTDGSTILGADDKAGVTVMLKMIKAGVPGLYYFFIGEEVGRRGSEAAAAKYADMFKEYKHCISFDRKGYNSIITKQSGTECTSTAFARALSMEFARNGMFLDADPTGSFTDSYSFTELIAECTNISVGYFNAHQHSEKQDVLFLEALTDACIKIDWGSLPAEREPEPRYRYKSTTTYYSGGQQRLYDNDDEFPGWTRDKDGSYVKKKPEPPFAQGKSNGHATVRNLVTPENIKDMTGLDVLCEPTREEAEKYVASQIYVFLPAWMYGNDKVKVQRQEGPNKIVYSSVRIADLITLARKVKMLVLAAEVDVYFYKDRIPETFSDKEWDAYCSLSNLVQDSKEASVVQATMLLANKYDYYTRLCTIMLGWYKRNKDDNA